MAVFWTVCVSDNAPTTCFAPRTRRYHHALCRSAHLLRETFMCPKLKHEEDKVALTHGETAVSVCVCYASVWWSVCVMPVFGGVCVLCLCLVEVVWYGCGWWWRCVVWGYS